MRTYEAHRAAWADREGLGFYPSREEASEAAYDRLGGGPFLVKQVLSHEPIYQLGPIEP